jgi:CBS domain-containing protein
VAKKARDIMTGSPECVGENDSIIDAAKKLQKLNIGAMPICGEDDRLKGMLTDRDIVIKVLAEGRDPSTTRAGELGEGKPVTIGADDDIDLLIKTMAEYKVRRLPVIDGHKLIGIVSQADVARNIDEEQVGKLVEIISE